VKFRHLEYGQCFGSCSPQEIDRTKPKHERTYKGRPPTIQPDEVRRLKDEEKLGASEIATRLGIGRASVYRALKGTA
jgi:DNA invertase Pin-like site-specific DNA recombinase